MAGEGPVPMFNPVTGSGPGDGSRNGSGGRGTSRNCFGGGRRTSS